MKMAKSASHISFLDRILGKKAEKQVGATIKEERQVAEQKAAEFEANRKVQASKFPKMVVSEEAHPGTKTLMTDEPRIIETASKALKTHIANLVGKGGFAIDLDEFRNSKCHNDIVDNSNVTDSALLAFAVNFQLPKNSRTAKFVVSYNEAADDQFKVENVFYSEDLKEHELNTASLNNFLSNTETSVKTANTEKPLVWFNPTNDTIEAVETVEPTVKIAARLKTAGFEIESNYWVDATYNPAKFGKICVFANVPLNRVDEFKKIASWSDEEWVNRASEGGKEQKSKEGKKEWVDRALGQKDERKEYKDNAAWAERALQDGKEGKDGRKDYGNPYGTEAKLLYADGARKEAVKKALASKDEVKETISEKINKLEDLLK